MRKFLLHCSTSANERDGVRASVIQERQTQHTFENIATLDGLDNMRSEIPYKRTHLRPKLFNYLSCEVMPWVSAPMSSAQGMATHVEKWGIPQCFACFLDKVINPGILESFERLWGFQLSRQLRTAWVLYKNSLYKNLRGSNPRRATYFQLYQTHSTLRFWGTLEKDCQILKLLLIREVCNSPLRFIFCVAWPLINCLMGWGRGFAEFNFSSSDFFFAHAWTASNPRKIDMWIDVGTWNIVYPITWRKLRLCGKTIFQAPKNCFFRTCLDCFQSTQNRYVDRRGDLEHCLPNNSEKRVIHVPFREKNNFLYWNILRARPETFAYPVTSFKGHCPLRPVSGATLRWTKEIEHHILVQMIWIRVPKVMAYLDCRYHGKHCTLNHFELLGLFPRSKKQGFTGLPKNLWITFHKCHRDSLFTNSSTRQSNYNYTNITQWENAPILCQSSS